MPAIGSPMSELEPLTASLASPFGIAFLVLVVPPLWILGSQGHTIVRMRASIAQRRHRYWTYRILEEGRWELRGALPHGHQVSLETATIAKPAAREVYSATHHDGHEWDRKVTITHLLEKLDRLAAGVKMGVLDAGVWEGMSGHEITTLCRVHRNFIDLSQEQRADRYASLCEVDQLFLRIERERATARGPGLAAPSARFGER